MAADRDATKILDVTQVVSSDAAVASLDLSSPHESNHTLPQYETAAGALPRTNHSTSTAMQPPLMTHDIHLAGPKDNKLRHRLILIAGVLVLGVVGVISLSNDSSLDSLMSILGLAASEDITPPPKKKKQSETPSAQQATATPSATFTPAPPTNLGDPVEASALWTMLVTRFDARSSAQPLELGPALTSDQEANFQAALNHEFIYQRYKAVVDLAALRAEGSEILLREALESPKFWTRMRALIALADLGDDITDEDIQKGLGDSHSELRARFFKRFERSPCDVGCFAIARASLPHLDERGRLAALRVISLESNPVRDKFMVAATLDPAESVRLQARVWLDDHAISGDVWSEIRALVPSAH